MRYWKAGLIFLIAFLIQPSLLNMINIGGYTPNLLLCLVVIFSFIYEEEMYGIVFGSFFGVLYDVCYSDVIGPAPIAFLVVAVGIMMAREYVNIENIFNMWIVSILSFCTYYLINWGLHRLAGNPIGIMYVFGKVPWIILYSMAVITMIYLILIRKAVRYRRDRYFK